MELCGRVTLLFNVYDYKCYSVQLAAKYHSDLTREASDTTNQAAILWQLGIKQGSTPRHTWLIRQSTVTKQNSDEKNGQRSGVDAQKIKFSTISSISDKVVLLNLGQTMNFTICREIIKISLKIGPRDKKHDNYQFLSFDIYQASFSQNPIEYYSDFWRQESEQSFESD